MTYRVWISLERENADGTFEDIDLDHLDWAAEYQTEDLCAAAAYATLLHRSAIIPKHLRELTEDLREAGQCG